MFCRFNFILFLKSCEFMEIRYINDIELLSNENAEEYGTFISNNLDSTIYHTTYWKNIVEKKFAFKPYYIISRNQNDEICAVLPLFYVNNCLGKRLESISYSPYGGGIGKKIYIKDLYEKALKLRKHLNCKSLITREVSGKYDSIFSDLNMVKIEKWFRQYSKITDPIKTWDLIDKSNRTNVRFGDRSKLTVETVKDQKGLREFYDLYLKIYTHLGFPVCSFDFFSEIWNNFHSKKLIEIFIARYDEKAISSTLNYLFNKTVYSANLGWDIKYSNLKPNNFIDWYLIKWCYINGYDYFDFGLTNVQNKGLFTYKNSFNTINESYSMYCYPKNVQYANKSDLIKNSGRFIISKLPVSFNRRFGMFLNKNFL